MPARRCERLLESWDSPFRNPGTPHSRVLEPWPLSLFPHQWLDSTLTLFELVKARMRPLVIITVIGYYNQLGTTGGEELNGPARLRSLFFLSFPFYLTYRSRHSFQERSSSEFAGTVGCYQVASPASLHSLSISILVLTVTSRPLLGEPTTACAQSLKFCPLADATLISLTFAICLFIFYFSLPFYSWTCFRL